MKIRTILVATDFSHDANAALEAASYLAKVCGSRLKLLHAYRVDIPAIYGKFGGDFVIPQNILESIRQAAEVSMAALVKDVAEEGTDVEGRSSPIRVGRCMNSRPSGG